MSGCILFRIVALRKCVINSPTTFLCRANLLNKEQTCGYAKKVGELKKNNNVTLQCHVIKLALSVLQQHILCHCETISELKRHFHFTVCNVEGELNGATYLSSAHGHAFTIHLKYFIYSFLHISNLSIMLAVCFRFYHRWISVTNSPRQHKPYVFYSCCLQLPKEKAKVWLKKS